MNATQGLIFYALRCTCDKKLGCRNLRVAAFDPSELKPCAACANAITDDEIVALLGDDLCLATSEIGARVLAGYYSSAPPPDDLTDATALAGTVPNDRLVQLRERVTGRPFDR